MDIVDAKLPPTKVNKRRKCKIMVVVLLAMGVACIATSLFCERIFEEIVKKKLVLKKGSEAYTLWQSVPTPVYMTYFLFNYTNIEDIVYKYATPEVSQVGPFVYREIRINEVTEYNEYNITYLQNYSYVFEPSLSCAECREDTKVYAPNIAFLTVLNIIAEKLSTYPITKAILKIPIDLFLKGLPGTTLFKKVSARELLWGYEDDLLHLLRDLKKLVSDFGIQFPDIEEIIKFQYNGTANAIFIGNTTILTGKEDINDVQKIVNWRGLDHAPYWNDKYAEMLNGSDGSHARPFISRGDKIFSFVPQICRSVGLEYEEDVHTEGIPLFRYSAKLFPLNPEFCNDSKTCVDGLLPMSRCAGGLGPPLYISAPHFYQADPKLVQRINGMKPNADLHKMNLDVDPITGVTMSAHKRIQLNIMGRRSFLSKSQSFRHDVNFLPILMLDEEAEIDKLNANKFKQEVLRPKRILVYGSHALLAIGIVIVVCALVLAVRLWHLSRRDKNKFSCTKPVSDVALQEVIVKAQREEKAKKTGAVQKTDLTQGTNPARRIAIAWRNAAAQVYDGTEY